MLVYPVGCFRRRSHPVSTQQRPPKEQPPPWMTPSTRATGAISSKNSGTMRPAHTHAKATPVIFYSRHVRSTIPSRRMLVLSTRAPSPSLTRRSRLLSFFFIRPRRVSVSLGLDRRGSSRRDVALHTQAQTDALSALRWPREREGDSLGLPKGRV